MNVDICQILFVLIIAIFILDFFMTKSYEKTIKELKEENEKIRELLPVENKEEKIGE